MAHYLVLDLAPVTDNGRNRGKFLLFGRERDDDVGETFVFTVLRHAENSCFTLFTEKTFSFGITGLEKMKQIFLGY